VGVFSSVFGFGVGGLLMFENKIWTEILQLYQKVLPLCAVLILGIDIAEQKFHKNRKLYK
jgi:hypothetical protein